VPHNYLLLPLIVIPLATSLVLLAVPSRRPNVVRYIAITSAAAMLGIALYVFFAYQFGSGDSVIQFEGRWPWLENVGFLGANGRGTHEYRGVMGRVDILTGTFGKALGGASGGYTAGRKEIIEYLRQRSRPYLFSNTLAPAVAAASLKALELVASRPDLRVRLTVSTRRFREGMAGEGFQVTPGEHPIVPVMLGDAHLAARMAERMLAEGVYVVGFSYPVVPKGAARIRVQISAALEEADIDFALEKFVKVGRELGVI
jgi:glycine C-acetyltransferase